MHRAWLLMVLLCLVVSAARAQDPVKVDTRHYKVEIDNDQVRVLRIRVGPHEKTPLHEHPARVVVFLTDHHVKTTSPDGKTEEHHGKAGMTMWSPAVKHAGENMSDQPFEVLEIELKTRQRTTTPALNK